MRRRLSIAFLLGFCLTSHAQKQVSFKSYSVTPKFRDKPVSPLRNTPHSRFYRTKIREAVAAGPNFADHYTLAIWGCGSSCALFSIIDDVTGKVYDFPYSVTWNDEIDYGVTFRRNSKALRIGGYLNESEASADRWYVWDGATLSKIAERPSRHSASGNLSR
jgi:hypothetical protein